MTRRLTRLLTSMLLVAVVAVTPALARAGTRPLAPRSATTSASFIGAFSTVSTVTSTVPANGDVNPYGVAVVPRSMGRLRAGNILVSNFNSSANLQGTGTTIVQIAPNGTQSLFAQIDAAHLPGACPGGVGLTTALAVLKSGWVIVGSLPTTDGTSATAKAGCLLVLNSSGTVVETISNVGINGPWDMSALDFGSFAVLFVTNVLYGTVAANGSVVHGGTVVRLVITSPITGKPFLLAERVIGTGLPEKTDPAALVIGPTGVGLGRDGTLYVADSVGNSIDAISQAITRTTSITPSDHIVSANGALDDPLGLAIAPNGDILTTNGNDGNLVETTPGGAQVGTVQLDDNGTPPGAGALFGLAIAPGRSGVYFVDDGTNTLNRFSASAQVSIQNFAFSPTPLTIKAGGTVTWTDNQAIFPHTVTADDNSFSSGLLHQGSTYSHTFTTPGTYTYHCAVHPFMHGTVIVTP